MHDPLNMRPQMQCSHGHVGIIHQTCDVLPPCAWGSDHLRVFLVLPLLLTIFLISCGGVVSSDPPPPVTVTVSPASAQPFAGTSVQFTATVQNAGSSVVNWQVNGKTGGDITTIGAISASGLYTAHDPPPTPPNVTVSAVLQSDPAKSGSSNVTIQPLSAIHGTLLLSPKLSSVTTSQTLQLEVASYGLSNNQVSWAVDGFPGGNTAAGTITNGLYTPPGAAGPHLIIATLGAAIGSATVEVTDFAGTFTWRNDPSRSGQNSKELALAPVPTSVTSSTFGKLFSCPLDGYAYAQQLYVANLAISGSQTRNVVIVATAKDTVFAFDADTNANPCVPLWQRSLIPSGEEAVPAPTTAGITSYDFYPFIGIMGTPVIDPSTSTLYVVAKTQTTSTQPAYYQRLFALDLATGQPIQPSGMLISAPASVDTPFSAMLENQRAALLLDNGTVYIAFGSYDGQGDYHGWLMGYDASTLQQTSAFDVAPGIGAKGGIWQSGGGPSADSNHNVFVVTGIGMFDVNRGGQNYGDSFLKFSPTATGGLALTDYLNPCQTTLGNANPPQGLGSSAPLLLPDSIGPVSNPNLLLGAAKNGSLYLVDRNILGGYDTCSGTPPQPVQEVPVGDGPILSTPLFWNNTLYVAAGNGKLKAFPMSGGVLAQSPLPAQSAETLGPQGATPVLSSNGASNAITSNAIVWLIDASGALAMPNTPAILRAFDASNLSKEIYNSAMVPSRDAAGLAVKFTVPTVANGKVYVGTQTELDVYGLLP